MSCDCKLCTELKQIEQYLSLIKEEQVKDFFDKFTKNHYDMSDDLNYYQAILNGDWPSSVEILEQSLVIAKQKRDKLNAETI